jgi:hypothetical protein
MPNDAKNSTIMPIIIIKVNSGATKFVMKTNPGIGESNKYSMVMCPIWQQKTHKMVNSRQLFLIWKLE